MPHLEASADILDFLTVCGIRQYDANAHSVAAYDEAMEAWEAYRESPLPVPPLECTIMQLAIKKSTDRIETAIVRLLKSAHAAGRGCGRPWIPTSRSALIDHVHAFPPLAEPWNFGIRPTEVFIRHRIQSLVDREDPSRSVVDEPWTRAYAVVDERDDELLYYIP